MTSQEFLAMAIPAAKASEASGGAPWKFAVAQSALETGYGKHAPGNMFFGIKANADYEGKRQLLTTTEYTSTGKINLQPGESILSVIPPGGKDNKSATKYKLRIKAYFRAYNSPTESFRDHATLMKKKRYKDAFQHKDARQFAAVVAAAGYATDESYLDKIESIIDRLEGKTPKAKPGGKPSPKPEPQPKSDASTILVTVLVLASIGMAIKRTQHNGRTKV